MVFQLVFTNLAQTNFSMFEQKLKDIGNGHTYEEIHNDYDLMIQLANEITNFSNHFQYEKTALFRISDQIELIITYLNTFSVPLSFILANRERRKLIRNLVPQKYRDSIYDILYPKQSNSRLFSSLEKDSSNV